MLHFEHIFVIFILPFLITRNGLIVLFKKYARKKWALVTVEEVRRVMRYILSNKAEIKIKADAASNLALQKFQYESVEKLFAEMLRTTFNAKI